MDNGIIKIYDFKEPTLIKMANDICREVEDGNTNALDLIIQAKAMGFMAKYIIKKVKDEALDQAGNYSKADSSLNGAKFSISNTGNTLNYSDDFEYADLERKLKFRKDQLKNAFDIKKEGGVYIDSNSGEEIPIVSIKKHSEQTLKISFK